MAEQEAKIIPEAAKTASTDQPVDVNPKITNINIKAKNSEILAHLAAKFKAFGIKPETGKARSQLDWFKRINLTKNSESSDSNTHIIDVQPDARFPFAYMVYYLVKTYPGLDIKSDPRVSLYSLLSYMTIAFNAFILLTDMLSRHVKSYWVQRYQNDAERKDYLDLLSNIEVPIELAEVLENFAAVYDPSKPECSFIPSFSSAVFDHDYGRFMPPQIGFIMHRCLHSIRANVIVDEVLRQFYNTIILRVGNLYYTVSHFIGGMFLNNNALQAYNNWVRDIAEAFFCPAVQRSHQVRPELAPIRITPQEFQTINDINIYDLLTCYNPTDYPSMRATLSAISTFIRNSSDMPSVPLACILEKSGGISTLTHTIETMQLPTWHLFNPPTTPVTTANGVTEVSPTQAATFGNFMLEAPEYTGKALYPDKETDQTWEPQLYLVKEGKYNHLNPKYEYESFDETRHVNPDAFVFQPYDRNLDRANIAMTLGLKIQANEIDSVAIPLPNINDSLYENNSCYVQGSLIVNKIKPVFLTTTANLGVRMIARVNKSHEINALAIRDGSKNVVPILATEDIRDANRPRHLDFEENHNNSEAGTTYTAWRNPEGCKLQDSSRYIWSSYRFSSAPNKKVRVVSFYYTLRTMYGTSVPLYRVRSPSLIIPRG